MSMRRRLVTLLGASAASPLLAQPSPLELAASGLAARQRAAEASPFRAELVKTGLYLVTGGGANTLVRFSPMGLVLVDGKSPGTYRPFMSAVRRIVRVAELPVRVLAPEKQAAQAVSPLARCTCCCCCGGVLFLPLLRQLAAPPRALSSRLLSLARCRRRRRSSSNHCSSFL